MNVVDNLLYATSAEYKACLEGLEHSMDYKGDWAFFIEKKEEAKAKYLDLIRTYGARTERSRSILQALAAEEKCDIIDNGDHAYLDNGIVQAKKATHMEDENDMGRQKERITLPNGAEVWVSGTTRAELVNNAIKATMNCISSPVVTPTTDESCPTFEEYAWHWFDTYHVGKICERTATNDRSIMNRHLIPEFGNKKMKEITHDDVQRLFDDRMHLSKSSHKKFLNILKQVFQSALEDSKVTKNIMESKRYHLSDLKGERKPLPYDDLMDILNHVNLLSEQERLYILLLTFTGARRGEVLALEWKDIDFKHKTVSITEAVHFDDGNTPTIGKTKSKAGVREVPLLAELEKVLTATAHKGRYIISGNKLISETMHQKMWDRIKSTIDMHDATAHVFRHTFGSFACYMKGSNFKALQCIMGHSSIQVTMDIYCNAKEDREHKQQIEKLFSGLWMEQKSDTMDIAS